MNKGRKKKMKKVIALIMCLVVVLSIATSAFAAPRILGIRKTLIENAKYVNTAAGEQRSARKGKKQNTWKASFDGAQPNKRVVGRVFGYGSGNGDGTGGEVVSATWVYSQKSDTWHPYVQRYQNYPSFEVMFGAKQDDRDNQIVTIDGKFYACVHDDY